MKLFLINLLLILSTTQLFSQQLTGDAIAGSWKVVNSQLNFKLVPEMKLDSNQHKKMEQMRIAFIGTIFNFNAHDDFTIEFTGMFPEFTKELEFLNHKKWKIEAGKLIAIGSEDDKYSLMKIATGVKGDKNFFFLNESPFVLEVIKQ